MLIVYGKPSCARCTAFKEKLALLGLVEGVDWRAVDVTDLQAMFAAGQKLEAVQAMSALAMVDDELPAVEMADGRVMRYAQAIAALKKERP